MAAMVAILDIKMEYFFLNLNVALMPPTNFQLNPTYLSGEDVAAMVAILDIGTEQH